jgi:copper(I)-binding protein
MIHVSKWRVLAVCGALWCALVVVNAKAQPVEVKEAWIRGTVAGQKASGAFMSLTSRSPARLVAAASPVAGVVEIHNMKMEGNVMKMFAVDGIDLPANRTVKLAPGGYHVMLMDLKQTLKAGDRVPLKLTFEMADKKRETLDVTVEVRDVTGAPKHGH